MGTAVDGRRRIPPCTILLHRIRVRTCGRPTIRMPSPVEFETADYRTHKAPIMAVELTQNTLRTDRKSTDYYYWPMRLELQRSLLPRGYIFLPVGYRIGRIK